MKLNYFSSAVFVTQFEFNRISDFNEIENEIKWVIEKLSLNKVYLETHRSGVFTEKEKLMQAKALFEKYGVKVAGGITTTEPAIKENELFSTLCYSNKHMLDNLKRVVRYTSELFDEYIIDDFYFTHCKCDLCIEKKGTRSWIEYRLETLKDVAENIIIKESKAVNKNVKVILKYPNWYDHHHKAGYNLEMATNLFDGIYTGTETRDPFYSQQNLQRYCSYFLMRYLENTKPGANLGGWFDTLDCSYNLNSVVQQANLTLFSKAKESTVFSIGALLRDDAIFAPLLGFAYEKFDRIAPLLGNPKGIATYKPFHSSGEDFIHGYLGMLGIPFEPVPYFPEHEKTLFLSEAAVKDPEILSKVKKYLSAGNTLFITSGFVRALNGKGIEDIVDVYVTQNKALVNTYGLDWNLCAYDRYYQSKEEIMFTQIDFGTNDTKNSIAGIKNNKSYPILLETEYSKGKVYVLNIPDEYGALLHMPKEITDQIRRLLMNDFSFNVNGSTPFGLFAYDNNTFIIHSFADSSNYYEIILNSGYNKLTDVATGQIYEGVLQDNKMKYEINIKPSYYKVLRAEKE
jgi:hypothetical protein